VYSRVYVEIGNICNLSCSFCPKTSRELRQMSVSEFDLICKRLHGRVKSLLFHVMGEPLLHPNLGELLKIAKEYGFPVSITTNGVLLPERGHVILENAEAVHRVSISLHAIEGNGGDVSRGAYLLGAIKFAKKLTALDKNAVFRLWNLDTDQRQGSNSQNGEAESILRLHYPEPWEKRYTGYRMAYRTFLEYDGIFTWPSECLGDERERGTCHALSRQIAILADGTVVPCCLDSEGLMPLGNIFRQELEEIMESKLAADMLCGFREGKLIHPVCKKCTYSMRFKI
jgi:radical SAM protein with 4Fe4S-binding SPASM domain